MELIVPTVHLNGTSKKSLLEAIEEAYSAITEAELKMREVSPNGRDYYPQGPDAIYKAQDQHFARLQKLREVKDELQSLAEAIDLQGR